MAHINRARNTADALVAALREIKQRVAALERNAGKQFTAGTSSLTWSGASGSNTVTITHGLGRTPGEILLTLADPGAAGVTAIGIYYANPTATTFQVLGIADPSITDTVPFSWLAVAP